MKEIINSNIIYKICLGKGKKFKAFRYLQLLKMRNIYFRFLGYKFITPAVEKGRRGDIYAFFHIYFLVNHICKKHQNLVVCLRFY